MYPQGYEALYTFTVDFLAGEMAPALVITAVMNLGVGTILGINKDLLGHAFLRLRMGPWGSEEQRDGRGHSLE